MKPSVAVGSLIVACLTFAPVQAAHAESSMDAGKAFTKLGRGAVNLFTGWVEIPKRIQETTLVSGAWSGFTWGLLRGLGYGFIRTAAGGYEVITFPFPAPPDYEPVIQPEFVFTNESSDSSYHE